MSYINSTASFSVSMRVTDSAKTEASRSLESRELARSVLSELGLSEDTADQIDLPSAESQLCLKAYNDYKRELKIELAARTELGGYLPQSKAYQFSDDAKKKVFQILYPILHIMDTTIEIETSEVLFEQLKNAIQALEEILKLPGLSKNLKKRLRGSDTFSHFDDIKEKCGTEDIKHGVDAMIALWKIVLQLLADCVEEKEA